MRKIVLLALIVVASPVLAQGSHEVGGYVRSDGTYVAPHEQTNADSTKLDNWSTRGNYNPATGQNGTVDPYHPTRENPYGTPDNHPRR